MKLPESMFQLADLSSNEEAWKPSEFPRVLDIATVNGLACLGGQFQFRGPIGTAEMYWVDADTEEKKEDESWDEYVRRANQEAFVLFEKRMKETDFDSEAKRWKHIQKAIEENVIKDPKDYLYFVAYFNREPQIVEQGSRGNA